MTQMSLLDVEAQIEIPAKPLTRQEAVLAALRPEGLEASEAGAVAHELREGRWRHSRDERCRWCAADGKTILRALEAKGLATYVRGRQLWCPVVEAVEGPEGFPPDFDGQFGTYNALPSGY